MADNRLARLFGAFLLCFVATGCGDDELDGVLTKNEQAFFEDVLEGSLSKVRKAIADDLDINVVNASGRTALHLAIIHNRASILEAILEAPELDINKAGPNDTTALHYAAAYGTGSEIVRKLLNVEGIRVNTKETAGGASALISAVRRVSTATELAPDVSLIKSLARWEATNLDLLDNEKKSVLYYAARYNPDPEVIRVLLSSSASQLDRSALYNGVTAFRVALLHNNAAVVEVFFEDDALLSTVNAKEKGVTHLVAAVRRGNATVVEALLRVSRLDINALDSNNETALHEAASKGHVEVVKALLGAHLTDVDAANSDGNTALHTAALEGHADVAKALLESPRVNVNVVNSDRETAWTAAISTGNVEVLKVFFKSQRVDIREVNNDGETALHTAVLEGNLEVLKAFETIRAGVLKTTCADGKTLLKILDEDHLNDQKRSTEAEGEAVDAYLRSVGVGLECQPVVSQGTFYVAATTGVLSTVKLALLQTGADAIDVNAQDEDGNTALHVAAWNSHLAVVEALLTSPNIDVNAVSGTLETALHWAAWQGYTSIVEALLAAPNIEVNAKDNRGRAALHSATWEGRVSAVEALLTAPNIDVNAGNRSGETAFHWAALRGHVTVLRALLTAPNIDVNVQSNSGKTALYLAIEGDNEAVFDFLLNDATDLDVNVATSAGVSHLLYLVRARNVPYLRKLLAGTFSPALDINAANGAGETVLHRAAERGHAAVVEALLTAPNIEVNAENSAGETAWNLALNKGHAGVVEALLENPNIAVNAESGAVETAWSVALSQGHSAVVAALLKNPTIASAVDTPVNGLTPLIHVLRNHTRAANASGTSEAVLELLNRGADVNQKNGDTTALHYAVLFQNRLGPIQSFVDWTRAHGSGLKANVCLNSKTALKLLKDRTTDGAFGSSAKSSVETFLGGAGFDETCDAGGTDVPTNHPVLTQNAFNNLFQNNPIDALKVQAALSQTGDDEIDVNVLSGNSPPCFVLGPGMI